jgi:tripartite ATP-independent transporter DctP family solute receptor
MKKQIVMCVLFAFVFTGVVSAGGGSETRADSGKVKISLATVIPPGTPVTLGLDNYSKALNDSGKFETAVFPAGQLGSLTDVIDRCLAGDPVIETCDPADLADVTIKDLSVVQAPFLFETWDQVDKVTASSWWKDLTVRVEQKGMKILAYNWAFGERHILTRTPIRTLADIAGKKIRVPNNVNFVRSFTALGAAPTPMALAEVFTSIQQGTIDGLENPYSDIFANKFHEVGKYIVEDDHIKQICLLICGTEFFNKLTKDQQDSLIELAQKSGEYQRSLLLKTADDVKAQMAAAGVTFTKIDRTAFTQAIDQKYYPQFTEWTAGLRETVQSIIR